MGCLHTTRDPFRAPTCTPTPQGLTGLSPSPPTSSLSSGPPSFQVLPTQQCLWPRGLCGLILCPHFHTPTVLGSPCALLRPPCAQRGLCSASPACRTRRDPHADDPHLSSTQEQDCASWRWDAHIPRSPTRPKDRLSREHGIPVPFLAHFQVTQAPPPTLQTLWTRNTDVIPKGKQASLNPRARLRLITLQQTLILLCTAHPTTPSPRPCPGPQSSLHPLWPNGLLRPCNSPEASRALLAGLCPTLCMVLIPTSPVITTLAWTQQEPNEGG